MYNANIMEHYRNSVYAYEMTDAQYVCTAHNQACGDTIIVYIQAGTCIDCISFSGEACALSRASASMLCAVLLNMSVHDACAYAQQVVASFEIGNDALLPNDTFKDLLIGFYAYPMRMQCAQLAWSAFLQLPQKL